MSINTFAKPSPEAMSRVGLQQPLEPLVQGRLPSAVLTEQGMHLSRTHSKIDPIMCDQSPTPLDQAVRLAQQRLPTGWRHEHGRAVPFTPHRSAPRLVGMNGGCVSHSDRLQDLLSRGGRVERRVDAVIRHARHGIANREEYRE